MISHSHVRTYQQRKYCFHLQDRRVDHTGRNRERENKDSGLESTNRSGLKYYRKRGQWSCMMASITAQTLTEVCGYWRVISILKPAERKCFLVLLNMPKLQCIYLLPASFPFYAYQRVKSLKFLLSPPKPTFLDFSNKFVLGCPKNLLPLKFNSKVLLIFFHYPLRTDTLNHQQRITKYSTCMIWLLS
jgi:hypothetical protein